MESTSERTRRPTLGISVSVMARITVPSEARHSATRNKAKGASYLVIPNLYSCDPKNEEESARALAMNQLAGVLDDLNLVRWPQRPPLRSRNQ